ncbi:MAG: RagB/SusD family nutrient uptake outer membrane protein [Ginsengibacter sp.]
MKFRFRFLSGILLLLAAVTHIKCNKDKLNIPPPNPSEASYFTNENEFRAAILGAYAATTDYYSSSNIPGGSGSAEQEVFFLPGDDLTVTGTPAEAFEVFGNAITPATGKIQEIFGSSYVLINRANKVLEKIEAVPDGIYKTPNLKDYNKGEALFLRGFAHYMLWNIFGTAPVNTVTPTTPDQLNPPSSKGTELLDQAIKDFTDAAALLPPSWSTTDVGRATANSANGMLGKCLVFRATVNKTIADYQAGIAAFDKINGAALTPNFEDNFDVSKENNQESLYEFQAGVNINGFQNSWLSNDQADVGVSGSYWQCYYNGNGTYMGGGLYTATAKLKNSFDPNDPRLPLTLNVSNNNITRYILKDQPEGPCNSRNNARILRYADVLLLKAEALLQSGGSTSSAIGLINQVRTRARNMVNGGTQPADFDIAETNKSAIMQLIMDERLRELAGEGQRWFDLRRWAIGGIITLNNNFFSSANSTQMAWNNDNHFLNFPIPNSETDKNPNIKQNPGY